MCAKKVKVERVDPVDALEPRALGDIPRTVVTDDGQMDEEITLRILRGRMTWKEWFLYDLLRYWYGLGALTLVAFSITYVSWKYHVKDFTGLAVLAIAGFALIVLEFLLYRAMWPKGAFTEGWPAGRRLRRAVLRLRWRL